MIHLHKFIPLLVGFTCALAFTALAQDRDDPLSNFDGSKKEITKVDSESESENDRNESDSGSVSLGELSKDEIKQKKQPEAQENGSDSNGGNEAGEGGESGSGTVSLGELSKDEIKQDKLTESLENELEAKNAKSEQTEDLIQSTLENMNRPLTASGLELNHAEVFPADI